MDWKPEPLDTSKVELPPLARELAERIARHVHDTWAKGRLDLGWRHGPVRSDAAKEHPSLVAYEKLSEEEKDFDRRTAGETLKALTALGYRIEPVAPVKVAGESDPALREVLAELEGSDHDLTSLLAVWRAHAHEKWAGSLDLYRKLAERFLGAGEPLLAHDVVTAGLAHAPRDMRLRQLLALSLARAGATRRAQEVLVSLRREEHPSDASLEETLGLLARTHKDLWRETEDASEAKRQLEAAHALYAEAFARTKGTWTGINAATTAVFLGKTEPARSLAREVRELAHKETSSYWTEATLGEAALILSEPGAALEHYGRAAALGGKNLADLSTTRRQARLLLERLGMDVTAVERHFPLPSVVAFAGAAADGPAEALRGAMARAVDEAKAGIGFATLATASDLVFLETLQERGLETHVVLADPPEETLARLAGVEKERSRGAIERATEVRVANPHGGVPGPVASEFVGRLVSGLAALRARALDTHLVSLVARRSGEGWSVERSVRPETPTARLGTREQRIVVLLFADAVGYSKLSEEQIPRFVEGFLAPISKLMEKAKKPPLARNTWGDALYLVFEDAQAAGEFALALRDWLAAQDPRSVGLPANLSLRIALHAGPAFPIHDPVIDADGFMGSHVSFAARIEPITPAGEVFASQSFAALAARAGGFACEYVGRVPFAKGYGTFPLYHVRRG
jgi:class 3 adenylate cyclase